MQRYEHGGNIYGNDGVTLDFSVNTNPLGMPESVKRAVVEQLPAYARYPDPHCRKLRAALAAHQGIKNHDMVLCGNGAAELIFALCACTKPRKALVLSPTFSEYERAAKLFGCAVLEHRLLASEDFVLTERILEQLNPEIDVLFLCNPNNPSGRLGDPLLLNQIAITCYKNGTLLLLDECFIEFTRGQSMLPKLGHYPNLLILQAFTKIYAMAGLRLGTLYCSDTQLLARIGAFCPTWNVSAVSQAAGIAALQETGWIEKTRRTVEDQRGFLSKALQQCGLHVYPGEANFLLMESKIHLYQPLKSQGILTRCCANFNGLNEYYIRIGIKKEIENQALVRAIAGITND